MKRWIFVILVVAAVVIISIMFATGKIHFTWETATMVFAALAAPFKLVASLFTDGGADEVLEESKKRREEEKEHRRRMSTVIEKQKSRVAQLDQEIELQNTKLALIEEKKRNVEKEVQNMTLDETKNEVRNLFGE